MRYRKLGPGGDYSFGHSEQDFYRDVPEAPGQAVQTRLLLWLGEWFLNTSDGTQYLQGILGKKSLELADTTIQDRALGTQGIRAIQNYQSAIDADNRALTVTFNVDTIYGPTTVEIQNYGNY